MSPSALVWALGCCSLWLLPTPAAGTAVFVSAGAAAGGDGSQGKPFATLQAAQTAVHKHLTNYFMIKLNLGGTFMVSSLVRDLLAAEAVRCTHVVPTRIGCCLVPMLVGC